MSRLVIYTAEQTVERDEFEVRRFETDIPTSRFRLAGMMESKNESFGRPYKLILLDLVRVRGTVNAERIDDVT